MNDQSQTTRPATALGAPEAPRENHMGHVAHRINSVDMQLAYITERVTMLANRLFGPRSMPETTAISDELVQDRPPAMRYLDQRLASLEAQAKMLEDQFERFDDFA